MARERSRLDGAEFVGSSPDASAVNDLRKAVVAMYELFKQGTALKFRDAEGEFSIEVAKERIVRRNKVLRILLDVYQERLDELTDRQRVYNVHDIDITREAEDRAEFFEFFSVEKFIRETEFWPRVELKGVKPELWNHFLELSPDFAKFWVNPDVAFSEFRNDMGVSDEEFRAYLIDIKLFFFTIAAVVARSRADIAEMTAQLETVQVDEDNGGGQEDVAGKSEASESGTFHATSIGLRGGTGELTAFTPLEDDGTIGSMSTFVVPDGVDDILSGEEGHSTLADIGDGVNPDAETGEVEPPGWIIDGMDQFGMPDDGAEVYPADSFFGDPDEFLGQAGDGTPADPGATMQQKPSEQSGKGRGGDRGGVFAKLFGRDKANQKPGQVVPVDDDFMSVFEDPEDKS